jgi:hypothetical protein
MNFRWHFTLWIGIACAIATVSAADIALARGRQVLPSHCLKPSKAIEFSWEKLWFAPKPRPNGCAPPVFVSGEYIGQDPDPNVRFQLSRDPETGYTQVR